MDRLTKTASYMESAGKSNWWPTVAIFGKAIGDTVNCRDLAGG